MKNSLVASFITLAMGLFLGACEDAEDIIPELTTTSINFNFTHQVSGSALNPNNIQYTNASGNEYSVINCRYIVSDFRLYTNGKATLIDDEHYVDIADANTFSYTPSEKIEFGVYDSITFVFGLDTLKNISGTYVNPPLSDMAWPSTMGGGYHYMQLEGYYEDGSSNSNYAVHMGASGGNPYFVSVSLTQSSFIANNAGVNVTIEMDINQWFTSPNDYDFNTFGAAIMGNQTAQGLLQANGHNVFSITSIQ